MVSECGDMADAFEINKPTNNFTKNILKSFIGMERASMALKTLSMQVMPTEGLSGRVHSDLDLEGKQSHTTSCFLS